MADNFEQFIADAKRINLTSEEKRSLKRLLSTTLHINPIVPVASGWYSWRFPALVSLGVVLFIMGVPYMAGKSLPGTSLYTIKVHVSEPTQRTFILSDEGKVEFDVELAERRQTEAESMATNSGF